jgi:hypothetical protein
MLRSCNTFKDKSVPIISHSYNTPIETKIFNYKNVLQDLNIYYFKYINLLIAPMQVKNFIFPKYNKSVIYRLKQEIWFSVIKDQS